jgi:hypothetical protein
LLSTIPLLLVCASAPAVLAQEPRPTGFPAACAPDEVQVMPLGTHHFQGSSQDAVSGERENMLTPARQAELEDLVVPLARWAPEQIMVEAPLR